MRIESTRNGRSYRRQGTQAMTEAIKVRRRPVECGGEPAIQAVASSACAK